MLENKLGIDNSAELAREEECIAHSYYYEGYTTFKISELL